MLSRLVIASLVAAAPLHHVGVRLLHYSDAASSDPETIRLWYPTAAPEEQTPLGAFAVSIAKDAAMEPGQRALIIVSHGHGGESLGHHDTAEALARAGFVVATFDHAGDTVGDLHGARGGTLWRDRPRQLQEALDAALADAELKRVVDPRRIGALGYSAGGYTVLVGIGALADTGQIAPHCRTHASDDAFCAELQGVRIPAEKISSPDPRIRSAVVLAPVGAFIETLRDVHIPVLLWRAGRDEVLTQPFHAEHIHQLLPSARYEVEPAAGHYAFLAHFPERIAERVGPPAHDPPGFDRDAFHVKLNAKVVEFFHQTLDVSK